MALELLTLFYTFESSMKSSKISFDFDSSSEAKGLFSVGLATSLSRGKNGRWNESERDL